MPTSIRRNLTRTVLTLAILAAATPLTGFRGRMLYDLSCLIEATKDCYAKHGLTWAAVRCIADASPTCKV